MSERDRGWRHWQCQRKMMRRLKLDWNEHYDDFACPCRTNPRVMARFADTPAHCSCSGCGNIRRHEKGRKRLTMQERRSEVE
jgi:hypothetical protein